MANSKHIEILREGVDFWNQWREKNPTIIPDLSDYNLTGNKFGGINFSNANLQKTGLGYTELTSANLNNANLSHAAFRGALVHSSTFQKANLFGTLFLQANLMACDFTNANLYKAKLNETQMKYAILNGANLQLASLNYAGLSEAKINNADLQNASLSCANLMDTEIINSNLKGANLTGANCIGTNFSNSNIENYNIYGISVWDIKDEGLKQKDLIISLEPRITVDNLEVAQFLYLLLNNRNIRSVIDNITSKAVLILGRFTEERLDILDSIRNELRKHNYLPILFDFKKPSSKDLTETIITLHQLSRFVIADLTDPKSIPHELSHIIRTSPSIPVIPIIQKGQREYSMFETFLRYPWVLPIYTYESKEKLLATIKENIIIPAEEKAKEQKPK